MTSILRSRLTAAAVQGGIAMTLTTPDGAELPLRHGRGVAFTRAIPSGIPHIASVARLEEPALFTPAEGVLGAVAVRRTDQDPKDTTVLVLFASQPPSALLEERCIVSIARQEVRHPRVDELPDGSGLRLSWTGAEAVEAVHLSADGQIGSAVKPPEHEPAATIDISADLATALIAQYGTTILPTPTAEPVLINDRADPFLLNWNNEWLFVATDEHLDTRKEPSLLLRRAPTIASLAEAPDHRILQTGAADIGGHFWAPELHLLDGVLWCLFSPSIGSAHWTDVRSCAMRLRSNGDPAKATDWHDPVLVLSAAGEPLQLDAAHPGLSLDMTLFRVGTELYAVWSQRYLVGDVLGDAELWIATVAEDDPTRLTSAASKICKPELPWEMTGTNVVEGAFALFRNNKIFLVYSAGDVGVSYTVGVVSASITSDLLAAASWTKTPYPLLDTDPARGIWGPGHGMFTTDDQGESIFIHHLRTDPQAKSRHTIIQHYEWTTTNLPALDTALTFTPATPPR